MKPDEMKVRIKGAWQVITSESNGLAYAVIELTLEDLKKQLTAELKAD